MSVIVEPTEIFGTLAGCALVLGVPGPTNALLAAAGGAGRRDGLVLVGAVVAGYVTSVSVLRLVGAPILAEIPAVAPLLRLALAGWLLFLGCCLWRRSPAGAGEGIGPRAVFLATLLNPKAAVFAFALWPTGADGPVRDGRLALWFAGLVLVVAVVSTAWFQGGRRLAGFDQRAGRLLVRTSALLLFGFAALLGATAVTALG